MPKKPLGLYIHIPFCQSKCPYCDFYSNAGKADYRRYVDALLLHLEDYSESLKNYSVDTLYIGGGTPSILPAKLIIDLIESIADYVDVEETAEITMEANPATLTASTLKKLRKVGVNRLSIGLQSAQANELKALGRIHSFEQFRSGFLAARDAGFENISVDLMYGIPEQTPQSLAATLDTVIALAPEHISLYGLKIEPNTPFGQMQNLPLPDEDTEVDMYLDAIDKLEAAGYFQYEISNFSRPGLESKHNLKYWNCEEYLGLGPGSHSYFGGTRFSFKRDTMLYIDAMEDYTRPHPIVDEKYEVTPDERIGEYVMLRLRLVEGIDTALFGEMFGVEFETLYGQYLGGYINGGFMERTDVGYALTPVGMCVSNEILSTMLSFDSNIVGGMADGTDGCA